jgi:hypothetical protein
MLAAVTFQGCFQKVAGVTCMLQKSRVVLDSTTLVKPKRCSGHYPLLPYTKAKVKE